MRLTEEELKVFNGLAQTETGKVLLKYLERVKNEVFNPKTLTKENFDARKEALSIIETFVENRIKYGGKVEEIEPNEYQ